MWRARGPWSGSLLIGHCCEGAAHRQYPGFDILNQVCPSVSTQARKYISSVGAALDLRTGLRTFVWPPMSSQRGRAVAIVLPGNPSQHRLTSVTAPPLHPAECHAVIAAFSLPSVPMHHRQPLAKDEHP